MRSGTLNDLVELLRPSTEAGALNSKKTTWVPARAVVHAERIRLMGKSIIEAAENFADYSAQFRVRYFIEAKPGWRLVERETGLTYTITNVIPDRRLQMKTLLCERVNE